MSSALTASYSSAPDVRKNLALPGSESVGNRFSSASLTIPNTLRTSNVVQNLPPHTTPNGPLNSMLPNPTTNTSTEWTLQPLQEDHDVEMDASGLGDIEQEQEQGEIQVEDDLVHKGATESDEDSGEESESDHDPSWDNGEQLTDKERAKIMLMDKFSRTQEMNCRRRARIQNEDMSWDNGEPLTEEERAAIIRLPWHERECAMNIRYRKRLEKELADEYSHLFTDLGTQKKPRPRAKKPKPPVTELRRSTRNRQ